MNKIWRAEAVLALKGGDGGDVAATAQLSASLAAKNAADILPLLPRITPEDIRTEILPGEEPGTVRIVVSLSSGNGGEDAAMMAAMATGLTVARMKVGHLLDVRPMDPLMPDADADDVGGPGRGNLRLPPIARKSVAAAPQPRRRPMAKPSALMGEVAAPKPPKAGNMAQREAFRQFMVANHLRASEWAKSAGVPPATIYAYLTGSAGMIAADVAEKLAGAAHVSVEDLFRSKD